MAFHKRQEKLARGGANMVFFVLKERSLRSD